MISWEWTALEVGITSKPMGKTPSEVTLGEIFAVFQVLNDALWRRPPVTS